MLSCTPPLSEGPQRLNTQQPLIIPDPATYSNACVSWGVDNRRFLNLTNQPGQSLPLRPHCFLTSHGTSLLAHGFFYRLRREGGLSRHELGHVLVRSFLYMFAFYIYWYHFYVCIYRKEVQ